MHPKSRSAQLLRRRRPRVRRTRCFASRPGRARRPAQTRQLVCLAALACGVLMARAQRRPRCALCRRPLARLAAVAAAMASASRRRPSARLPRTRRCSAQSKFPSAVRAACAFRTRAHARQSTTRFATDAGGATTDPVSTTCRCARRFSRAKVCDAATDRARQMSPVALLRRPAAATGWFPVRTGAASTTSRSVQARMAVPRRRL